MSNLRKYIDTEYASIWLERGIINIIWKGNRISLEMAQEAVQHRLLLSQKKEYPLYVDIRNIVTVDAKTRNFLRGDVGTSQASAAALHVNNPVTKLIGKVFITIDTPSRPTALYTDKTKALEWLEGFK